MSTAQFTAAAARLFAFAGETITLRRGATEIEVRGKARGYHPEELVGGIQQADREVRVMAEDVTFDPPLKAGDKVILHGRVLNIDAVDGSTGRAGDTLVFLILKARG